MTSSDDKIPLKQAEVSVRRFIDLALPHHLGLLQNHRTTIEKSLALGNWNKIKKEEINAMRTIRQLKNLVVEMEALREKVRPEELERFDTMMEESKKKAFDGMKDYLELQLKSTTSTMPTQSCDVDDSLVEPPAIAISTTMAYQYSVAQIKTDFELLQHQLDQRETCLVELEHLQREIRDLNGLFHGVNELVSAQASHVQTITENAEEALHQVQEGESNLSRALSYKRTIYPVVGALLGTFVGGPVGLFAGIKAGGLAAVGCGILGFTGGSVLKSNPLIMHGNMEQTTQQQMSEENDLVTISEDSTKKHK